MPLHGSLNDYFRLPMKRLTYKFTTPFLNYTPQRYETEDVVGEAQCELSFEEHTRQSTAIFEYRTNYQQHAHTVYILHTVYLHPKTEIVKARLNSENTAVC